jgi:hypothetical protein
MEPTRDAGREPENWRTAQGAYVAKWQGFADDWSKHRIQDMQSTLELAVRPWSSLDPKELAALQQKWLAGIVDRCVLDTIAFAENAASLPFAGIAPPASPAGRPAASPLRATRRGDAVA